MPPRTQCPDRATLVRLMAGQVPAGEVAALKQHVMKCPACSAQVRALKAGSGEEQTLDDSNAAASDTHAISGRRPAAAASAKKPAPAAAFPFLTPPQRPDEIGRLGDFRVLKRLGAGGMGMVFLAEDTSLERPVALKVMLPEAAAHKDAGARFLREAKLTAAIKNDHIVTIYRVGQHGDVPFLAMELLQGAMLEDRLRSKGKLAIGQVLRIGREIALGLEAAHAGGLIHRDIKPSNIWLEAPHDRVKILDFGLARQATGGEQLTQSGAILGTPAYMAPEQARGETVDARADLFSLGCVLYRLCTGQPAFSGPSVMAVLLALGTVTPPPVSSLRSDVPEGLEDLIDRLLAKDPASRPASAKAVVERIRAVEKEVRGTASTVQLPGPAAPPPARPSVTRRLLPWVFVAVLFAAAGLLAWIHLAPAPQPGPPIAQAQGTLRIEREGLAEGCRVVIKQNGAMVLTSTEESEVRLKPGEYQVALGEDEEGLRLSAPTVQIVPDGKATLKVTVDLIDDDTPVETKADGWVSLFNGKDVKGWKTIPGSKTKWMVNKDGVLSASGDAGYLFTERDDYENFEFRVEAMINAKGNSGQFFRAKFVSGIPPGYEAQICGPQGDKVMTGSLYPSSGDNYSSDERKKMEMSTNPIKPGEWFTQEVRAVGNRITIKVNGKTTVDFTDEKNRHTRGYLAIQHQSSMTEVKLKKIEVKRLPPTPTNGFVALFNGTDLSGWKQHVGEKMKKWEVKDGVLTSNTVLSHLYSEKANYHNFHLRYEARSGAFGGGAVLFRTNFTKDALAGYKAPILFAGRGPKTGSLTANFGDLSEEDRSKLSLRKAPHSNSEWFIEEIIAVGNHITIKVNGKTTVDFVDEKNTYTSGHITLEQVDRFSNGIRLQIRKIEIKELP